MSQIEHLHHLYSNSLATPADVVQAQLHLIQQHNDVLRAFTYVDYEGALRIAQEQTAHLKNGGKIVGKFFGIPVAVKDLEGVKGMPVAFGSLLFKDNVCAKDSPTVERLRKEGAIIIGKTTTPIFGSTAQSKNRLDGTFRNPWNINTSAGGSSSGSAIAMAMDMCVVATGSDAGGSIRIPASFCGVFGFKPTFGSIPFGKSKFEMLPFTFLSHCGPISKSVLDAATYMDVCSGYHPDDPTSLPAKPFSYKQEILNFPPMQYNNLRVGICINVGYDMDKYIDPGVEQVFRKAVNDFATALQLRSPPTWISSIDLPAELGMLWTDFVAAQNYGFYDQAASVKGKEELLEKVFVSGYKNAKKSFNADTITTIYKLRYQLNQKLSNIFGEFDILLTPTMPQTAWANDEIYPPRSPNKKRGEFASMEDMLSDIMKSVGYCYPLNFSGHPAASILAGFHPTNGMPVGLQVVAERHNDLLVLASCFAFENFTNCFSQPAQTQHRINISNITHANIITPTSSKL